jgi:hypothetical protein
MRKLLTGLALSLPLIVFAELSSTEQHQMDLMCFDTDTLFTELKNEYQEAPFFYGKTDDNIESTMSLWMKKGGESWTIVVTKKDLSCVMSMGKDLKLVRNGKRVL